MKSMTPYMRAKKAHNWLYRGVCVRILKEEFGAAIVSEIRALATHPNTAQHYDAVTTEALMINNKDPV